jgi:hypothetical protein
MLTYKIKTTTSNGIYLTLKVAIEQFGFKTRLAVPNVFVGVKNGEYYMYLPKLDCKDKKYQEAVHFEGSLEIAVEMAKRVIEKHFFKGAMPETTKVEVKTVAVEVTKSMVPNLNFWNEGPDPISIPYLNKIKEEQENNFES